MHEAGQALLVEHRDPAVASASALVVGSVGVGAVIAERGRAVAGLNGSGSRL